MDDSITTEKYIFLDRLDPLYYNLEQIIAKNKNLQGFREEEVYLTILIESSIAQLSNKIFRNLSLKESELRDIVYTIANSTGDDKTDSVGDYHSVFNDAYNLLNSLNAQLQHFRLPYFGRIKFSNGVDLFIGKEMVMDNSTGRIIVSDWRSAYAEQYYKYNGPTKGIKIKLPETEISTDLERKLQYGFVDGVLTQVYDVRSGNSSADYLLDTLSRKVGGKMQDIVATIQAHQDEIIRSPYDKSILLQGSAGSGKTTVMLHRLAYLLYKESDKLKAQDLLFIGPSKLFLDYISQVLPSLGVEGIDKNNYSLFVKNQLKQSIPNISIQGTDSDPEILKIKSNLDYLVNIKAIIEKICIETLTEYFAKEIVDRIFEKYKDSASAFYNTVKDPFILATEFVYNRQVFDRKIAGFLDNSMEKRRESYKRVQTEMRRRLNIFNVIKVVNDYYKDNYGIDKIIDIIDNNRNKVIKYSDLISLGYINRLLFTPEKLYSIIFIDEGQDYTVNEIALMQSYTYKGVMNIAGDIMQGIKNSYAIDGWETVGDFLKLKNESVSMFKMDVAYRSSKQIVDFVNKFVSSAKYPIKPFLRESEPVIEGVYEGVEGLKSLLLGTKYNNIAIITPDNEKKTFISEILDFADKIVDSEDEEYKLGLQIYTAMDIKGIEVEYAILFGFDKSRVLSDMYYKKLFYVSATRPLHKLVVLWK